MIIKKLYYRDSITGWTLDNAEFSNFNLLVGASGVGKTKVLEAILNLQKIINGEPIKKIECKIEFEIENNLYSWEINYNKKNLELIPFLDFSKEVLFINKTIIMIKDSDEIKFKNKEVPKLPKEKSLIHLFREEDTISKIFDSFQNIIQVEDGKTVVILSNSEESIKKINEEKDIQMLIRDIIIKLYIAFCNN